MRIFQHQALITTSLLVIAAILLSGCSSSSKKSSPQPPSHSTSTRPKENPILDAELPARVQAISRKNRILTLRFQDGKVAKIKSAPSVSNFSQIGVGDTITGLFNQQVEIFPTNSEGYPLWPEIKPIKKAKGRVKPGTAIIRPYEYAARVEQINHDTREIILKGSEGSRIRVHANPELKRLGEIKPGDRVIARFVLVSHVEIEPIQKRASTALRPDDYYRRRRR